MIGAISFLSPSKMETGERLPSYELYADNKTTGLHEFIINKQLLLIYK